MTAYPHTYAEADSILTGRTPTRRKLGNNTYAERRDSGDIAVRLHETDVVTFHPDGSMSLDTGGWQTVTTKDRMNAVLASHRVYSVKGHWYVSAVGRWDKADRVPYADGLTIGPDGTVSGVDLDAVARETARLEQVKRDVSRFVKAITPEGIVKAWEDSGGDCFMCRFGQADCLASHVSENYFHATLARNAIQAEGYPSPDAIMAMVYGSAQRGHVDSLLTKALRKYLRKNLATEQRF